TDGKVYVGAAGNGMYVFDAHGCGKLTCEPLWVGQTAGYIENSPTVANGVVFVGDSESMLYAFDAAGCGQPTCPPLWTGTVGAAIYSSTPAVSDGVVYVGSYWDGRLNA